MVARSAESPQEVNLWSDANFYGTTSGRRDESAGFMIRLLSDVEARI